MTSRLPRVVKIVFIAGPYGDSSGYLNIDRNIARAREAAAALAEEGYGYYCPHLNSVHFEVIVDDVPVGFWYAMDLRFLENADAILMLEGWESSEGACQERIAALDLGIPVYYSVPELAADLER